MARSPRALFPVRARAARLTEQRRVRAQLISLAGLVGRAVRLGDGRPVGRVVDVVAHVGAMPYPPVSGLVVRVGRRRAFVPIGDVDVMTGEGVTLASALLDVRDFRRRDGELALMADVVDHQLVDVDGVQVVRAADLYLSSVDGPARLVGVEVGVQSLLRRLGPARWRSRPTPERVIDWSDIQRLDATGSVRVDRPNRELRRLRPGELADLLESLGRPQRDLLIGALDDDLAADALEEMDEARRDALLRQLPLERAAAIVAEMEPDEAAEALRELDDTRRAEIVQRLAPSMQGALLRLLGYPPTTAGGIMTTTLVTAHQRESAEEIARRLRDVGDHRLDVDAVLVLDDDGRLLDDVSLFELLVAEPAVSMGTLTGPPWPIVLGPMTPLAAVVDAVSSNRRGSVVVADDEGRPIGRILADDVVDALSRTPAIVHREVAER